MIRLMGLWLNTNKTTGDKFFKGRLGTADVLIFKNTKKNKENDFDYIMYMDEHKQPLPVENIDEDIPL